MKKSEYIGKRFADAIKKEYDEFRIKYDDYDEVFRGQWINGNYYATITRENK